MISTGLGKMNFGLFTDGNIYTSSDLIVLGSISTSDILASGNIVAGNVTSTDIRANGNISAPNNTPENCRWLRLSPDGEFICAANKFMTGVRKTADTVTEIRCCNL